HMISYNHHVLERRGEAEILWLNESLSHYAEELGGRSFLPADTATYCNYVFGDVYNSAQYFQAPQSYFLVDTSGIGALASRGAYWLFRPYAQHRCAARDPAARSGRRCGEWCEPERHIACGVRNIFPSPAGGGHGGIYGPVQ